VRTGIAVIAFGFVIERFNLFELTMANANSLDAGRRLQLERLSGSLGRYDGLALILLGIAIVVVAATRFVRTGQLLDDEETHFVGGVRAVLLSATAGDLLTTYIHVSVDLPYPVTKALQNFTKKGLVQDRSVPRYQINQNL
jgi:putative membrane protein